MLKNHLKIAFRNLARYKGYTAINIIGLAVGLACFILIAIWVQHELSYDRYYPQADRLYRLIATDHAADGSTQTYAVTAAAMIKAMADEFPEVEVAIPFVLSNLTVRNPEQNNQFSAAAFCFTEPAAIEEFAFEFVLGDPETALNEPNTMIITEETASRYFPSEAADAGYSDPIGKTLSTTGRALGIPDSRDYRITGVIKNIPLNSHLRRDIYASFSTLNNIGPHIVNSWGWFFFYDYVRLAEGVSPAAVEAKLPDLFKRHAADEDGMNTTLHLQPVADIYLHSNLLFDLAGGDIANVYIFSGIALLILFIACINFMNLATARSVKRSKEVGVKKVLGAERKQLILQFLNEAVVASLLAGIIAIGLVELFLPIFNDLAQKQLSIQWGSTLLLPALLLLAIAVGILSGSYPAFFLSAFRPVAVLKGNRVAGNRSSRFLRKGLIVFQFGISIVLIIGTGIIYKQLDFFQNKKLGFDKEKVIGVGIPPTQSDFPFEAFKNELLANSGILQITRGSTLPGTGNIRYSYRQDHMSEEEMVMMPTISVDEDYADLLNFELAAGRNFSRDFGTDSAAYIINETAAAAFGWQEPGQALGNTLVREEGRTGEVIGVVEDFHFSSLRQPIGPMIMVVDPAAYNIAGIKLAGGDIPALLTFIEETYGKFEQDRPYSFFFLDERLDSLYQEEVQLRNIFSYFAGLAIFIGCLGLFGLASFTAEQRTREVGIRKVLGASLSGIVILLSREFVKLVAIAFLIATPAAYFLMESWLADFAYRIQMGPDVFLLAGIVAMAVALISVMYNGVKAALSNPVDVLKHE